MDERYCFSANDIALYLLTSEMPLQRSNGVMHDLFDSHNHELREEYRADFRLFRSAVQNSIAFLMLSNDEYAEVEHIIHELKLSCPTWDESDEFISYFKFTKLSLLYSGIAFRRIKLRTLLRVFGYRRRSEQLMNRIHEAMDTLELQAFLKGYEPCDLSDIPIDRMVSIRLKRIDSDFFIYDV